MEEEKEKNSLTDQPAYQLSGQYTSCIIVSTLTIWHTILKYTLHIESISSTGLIVRTSLQVIGQLACPCVINHSGVALAYGIWKRKQS